jgi:NADH dehydrogenase
MPRRRRIVIVGGGFGGLFAARALRKADAEVILIDRNNYHLFQPLLYQVASAALSPADISQPIRTILRGQKNATIVLGLAQSVDLATRQLIVNDVRVDYDYLILAPGAVDNYFGRDDWAEYAPGMKQLDDATQIRARLLLSFEAAELETDPEERRARLSFVIVGGGPTGVELAGSIKELAVDVIPRDYRFADTRSARVILIEAGPRLLAAFHEDSSERALRQLHDLGVEVRLSSRVTNIDARGVDIGGERLASYNVIWAAGVRGAPIAAALGVKPGSGGRVPVRADCSIEGHSEVFVIGDAAYLVDGSSGQPVPGVSQGAMQMGRYVAKLLVAELSGKASRRNVPFHYVDLGSMATIGKSRAVVEIGRVRFGGLMAWLAWMLLHITVLIGFRNRISVFVSWVYNYVFFRRGSRLITGGGLPVIRRPRSDDSQ